MHSDSAVDGVNDILKSLNGDLAKTLVQLDSESLHRTWGRRFQQRPRDLFLERARQARERGQFGVWLKCLEFAQKENK